MTPLGPKKGTAVWGHREDEQSSLAQDMAAEASNGTALPPKVVLSAASQALVALAAMAGPLPAQAALGAQPVAVAVS